MFTSGEETVEAEARQALILLRHAPSVECRLSVNVRARDNDRPTIAHYRILVEIGEGGMCIAYKRKTRV